MNTKAFVAVFSLESGTGSCTRRALGAVDGEISCLLRIVLNNRLGWHHTLSLPKPTTGVG
jgi:hypothetical protein